VGSRGRFALQTMHMPCFLRQSETLCQQRLVRCAGHLVSQYSFCCAVATELLAVLGPSGAPLAAPLLARLDEIAGDAAAADAEVADDLVDARRAAESALGAAVGSLGPEAVLDTLPLRLEEVCTLLCSFRIDSVL